MQLEEAIAAGRARSLEPGEALEAEVAFAVFGDLDRVTSVERAGDGIVVR